MAETNIITASNIGVLGSGTTLAPRPAELAGSRLAEVCSPVGVIRRIDHAGRTSFGSVAVGEAFRHTM